MMYVCSVCVWIGSCHWLIWDCICCILFWSIVKNMLVNKFSKFNCDSIVGLFSNGSIMLLIISNHIFTFIKHYNKIVKVLKSYRKNFFVMFCLGKEVLNWAIVFHWFQNFKCCCHWRNLMLLDRSCVRLLRGKHIKEELERNMMSKNLWLMA